MSENKLSQIKAEERHLLRKIHRLKITDFNSLQEFREAKKQLQNEHREATKKRTTLQQKVDENRTRNKIDKTKQLIRDHIQLLRIEKDRVPLEIDIESLSVTIAFSNCNHRKSFSLGDFIPFTNERLWEDILNDGISVNLSRNCQKCFKEKKQERVKWGRHTDKPVGRANLTIRGLH